jgi:hypothetical protein
LYLHRTYQDQKILKRKEILPEKMDKNREHTSMFLRKLQYIHRDTYVLQEKIARYGDI